MSHQISRRNLLKGLGIGAAGLGLGFSLEDRRAMAQITSSSDAVPAYYRFAVGDVNVTIIKDASSNFDPSIFAVNASDEEIAAAVEAAGVRRFEDGTVSNLFDIMVVQTGDRTVLMDTGLGSPNSALNPGLNMLGITEADITDVIITHFHPDHVGGASFEGEIAYPNAQYHISQLELDFLMAGMEAEEVNSGIAGSVAKLQPMIDADQLATYSDEDEVVPNVMAMALLGHTMGHHGMMIESNGASIINVVDSIINPYIHIPNPNWQVQFDMDGDMAAETRTNLLTLASQEQIPVFGYHFPFPGVGYIATEGDSFRFTPAAY